jgi:hypothetical protein
LSAFACKFQDQYCFGKQTLLPVSLDLARGPVSFTIVSLNLQKAQGWATLNLFLMMQIISVEAGTRSLALSTIIR